jgi:hypothetical protein
MAEAYAQSTLGELMKHILHDPGISALKWRNNFSEIHTL